MYKPARSARVRTKTTTRTLLNFAAISALGTVLIACGLLFTGCVIGRHLVPHPTLQPGLISIDNPYDWKEANSGRPFWLTSAVLGLILSGAAIPMARKGIGKWSLSFGLGGPITFMLGSILYWLTPWYAYAPTSYQFPLHPWMPLLIWVVVFLAAVAAQSSTTKSAS